MLDNVYKIKGFFTEQMNNIEIFSIIGTIFGVGIQLFFLLKLHAVQFFSWTQTLNDFVIIFWYFVVMFFIFFLLHKLFKGKIIYKYIILIIVLLLLALHFLGRINHYIDSYFVIFFSVLAFFIFFGDIASLIKDLIFSIKNKTFTKTSFFVQLISLATITAIYGYMYVFLFRNVDDTFFNIYRVEFQYNGDTYMSAYFNDKYVFTRTPESNKIMIIPVSAVDYFSK